MNSQRAEFASLRQSLSVEIPCAVHRVPGSGEGQSFSSVIRGCVRRVCKLWADPVHISWKRELITPLDGAHRAEEAGLTALVGGAVGTAPFWAELTGAGQ